MHRLPSRLPRLHSRSTHLPRSLSSVVPQAYPAPRSRPSESPTPRRLAHTYSRQLSSAANPFAQGKARQKFKLADIGEGIKEVEIVKWSVASLGRALSLGQCLV